MPDIDPQIVSVVLTFLLLINAAKSTVTEVVKGTRVRGKSPAAKDYIDESPATAVVEKKRRERAGRRSIDPYAIIESHIVRGVVVVLLSFGVYKLIMAELPHRESEQRMFFTQADSGVNTGQWEYAVRKKTLSEGELNDLGNQGWELISHKSDIASKVDTYTLKRRKQVSH
ncbi:MAG TPA: hypothetical protein VNO50_02390 [Pyrinomonadaceae bacterium]|nr:hypothetical protein [Pyrinomonadaceae bacterium]